MELRAVGTATLSRGERWRGRDGGKGRRGSRGWFGDGGSWGALTREIRWEDRRGSRGWFGDGGSRGALTRERQWGGPEDSRGWFGNAGSHGALTRERRGGRGLSISLVSGLARSRPRPLDGAWRRGSDASRSRVSTPLQRTAGVEPKGAAPGIGGRSERSPGGSKRRIPARGGGISPRDGILLRSTGRLDRGSRGTSRLGRSSDRRTPSEEHSL